MLIWFKSWFISYMVVIPAILLVAPSLHVIRFPKGKTLRPKVFKSNSSRSQIITRRLKSNSEGIVHEL
ncbi:MAG: hypothetical protein ACI909_001123 [Planctomycetota bacterium]|jgi:hypothetical protein